MYPKSSVTEEGKLRLLYECNPMAFIAEQANGMAIGGRNRILDIRATELNQRVPFFCGSKNMVMKLQEFLERYH